MAEHVHDLASCTLPRVTKEEFYRTMQWGDMVACSGQAPVSKTIESLTGSLWSHILMVWLPFPHGPWLTLEATIDKGVHVGLLSDYTDNQDGPLVLLRRSLTDSQRTEEMIVGLNLLDNHYDWRQEVTFAAHKLVGCLPVAHPKGELYCSGLEYVQAATVAPYAYKMDATHLCMPTPEDIYTDPSVIAICLLEAL